MKSPARGWRPIRGLLLVVCAGGILAADNTWITTLDLDFERVGAWFSNAPASERPGADIALSGPRQDGRAQLSMGQLVNGLLFSRPAAPWGFASFTTDTKSSLSRRIVEFDPINQITGPDSFGALTAQSSSFAAMSSPVTNRSAGTASAPLPSAIIATGTGTWAVDSSGTWTNAANWAGNNVPDGPTTTADFSQVNITANRTVTLDVSRTVGSLTIGDTDNTHSYTLAASPNATLTFDQTGNINDTTAFLTQSATSHGDTISAPIVIGNVNYLSVRNFSLTNPLTISGNISAGAFNGLIEFDGGVVNVTGPIGNSGTGNSLRVGIASGSVVTLSGTNTYTGGTTVLNGAIGLINGDSSGATGLVTVVNGGTLGGTGTIGGPVSIGNGYITGGTRTDVGTLHIGTLTLNQNLTFQGGEESTATYFANIVGNMSDTLAIVGNLIFIGSTALDLVGTADGTTTYTLATYLNHSGQFSFVDNMPANYTLFYGPTELLLVPTAIPEPSTWIGAALTLAAIAFTQRRRFSPRSL